MAEKGMPRRAGECATGAGSAFQAAAGGTQKIARMAGTGTPYRITPTTGDTFVIVVKGRTRWALDRLRCAGSGGITSFTDPAPRLSAYVHNLRKLGVDIETVTEPHCGAFSGHHGRYILRCQAEPVKGGAA